VLSSLVLAGVERRDKRLCKGGALDKPVENVCGDFHEAYTFRPSLNAVATTLLT
jgi:hypothetical protein